MIVFLSQQIEFESNVMVSVIIIIGVLGYMTIVLYDNVLHRRIRQARQYETLRDFQTSLVGSSYNSDAIESAYEDLTELAGLSVRKDDRIFRDWKLDEDDVVEVLIKRLELMGYNDVDLRTYSCDTVEDYVSILDHFIRNRQK